MKHVVLSALVLTLGPVSLIAATSNATSMTPAVFAGTWECKADGESNVTAIFSVATDGSVHEHQAWTSGATSGSWDQTFTLDPLKRMWSARNVASNGAIFTGTSSGFDGHSIEFDGTQIQGSGVTQVRERLVADRPQHFTEVWEQRERDDWNTTSHADCSYDANT